MTSSSPQTVKETEVRVNRFSFGESVGESSDSYLSGGADQNNVQHQPPGEPEGVHQQPAPLGGLYDQCKRHGNSFPDLGLFLQNQGDQVTRNGRGIVNSKFSSQTGWTFIEWENTFWLSIYLSLVVTFIPVRKSNIYSGFLVLHLAVTHFVRK